VHQDGEKSIRAFAGLKNVEDNAAQFRQKDTNNIQPIKGYTCTIVENETI
jgi:hypothetical protein